MPAVPADTVGAGTASAKAVAELALHRYAYAIDDHDIDGLIEIVGADVVFELSTSTLRGRDEVRAAFEAIFPTRTLSRHLVGNVDVVSVERDGCADTVSFRGRFLFVIESPASTRLGVGTYRGAVRVTDDEWTLTHLKVDIDLATSGLESLAALAATLSP